ncbi:methyltransferase domain-containing protein [Limnobacter humi]|uniref:Methyltransferase domain-containing protein n=1 Tax=Limnobacter humi TaxID=1778671 RepID=A0ABT1WK68_9BURK|nr:class I SAM-dependent methyltransferase [Limnobacter humi]MCQ8897202.1 methyltransferase domain-containing protein [Limnobacter humi]
MNHSDLGTPSDWVVSAVQSVWGTHRPCQGLRALDLACGSGRHSRYLAQLGFDVHAVDRQVPDRARWPANVRFEQLDLEQPEWPLPLAHYDLIVVTNYLYRPHFEALLASLRPVGGVLVYETFMAGNARFGSPKNPDFLLEPGELLQRLSSTQVMRFEQGRRTTPGPAMIQRLVAITGPWSEIQSETHTF